MLTFIGLIIFIAAIVVLPIVLVNPRKIPLPWIKGREQSRNDWGWPFLAAFFGGPMLASLSGGLSEADNNPSPPVNQNQPMALASVKAPEPVKPPMAVKPPEEPSLDISIEELKSFYNSKIEEADVSSWKKLKSLKIKNTDDGQSFNGQFTEHIGLIGFINKHGKVKELTFIYLPSNDEQTNMEQGMFLTTLAGLTAQKFNPETKDTNGKKIIDIITKAMKSSSDPDAGTFETNIGNRHYYALAAPQMGLWFGVSSKKN